MTATRKTTPAEAAKKAAKVKARKTPAEAMAKKLSALDAAAKVLAEAGVALNAKELIEAMAIKGYWTSPGGKTPHATLFSAIQREIKAKGKDARFAKAEKGRFALRG